MYYQSKKTSLQLGLIDDILIFQLVCSFLIRLRACLGSSTNISCPFVSRSNHIILLSINLNIRQPMSQYLLLFCFACKNY
ncbi:hypothetical protein F383_11762 [Gossypium arboreum]|uniref:Uncharacterized protein n=1 Tax=Gossypium arboreum TaxID=29729 RepID=A0A0B0PUX5_GOSAR|nr:hypothetical protein F383_11762 [Gossypium arboreum]